MSQARPNDTNANAIRNRYQTLFANRLCAERSVRANAGRRRTYRLRRTILNFDSFIQNEVQQGPLNF